jgi:murein L,D-transpeptidase YcbB/YkuD
LTQQLQLILHTRTPASGKPPELQADGSAYRASPDLPCFYDRRSFAPAWIADMGLRPQADELLAAVADAPADGLRPEDYHLADLQRRLLQARTQASPADLAELDLALTDAFLRLAADLAHGKVNPELIYSDCAIDVPEVDLPGRLESALAAGSVRKALADLAPAHAGYRALKQALAAYRTKSDWPAVPAGPPLKPGDRNERVAALRARLEASGDLAPPDPAAPPVESDLFDAPLQAAVRVFQERHGLDADGAIGPATLEALDVPVADLVRQIEVNLDRWRWLPRDLGERYVMVNIAGFTLDVVEAEKPALSMRVVAGKPTSSTPMFTGTMSNIVLNPYWNVPPGILKNEILPKIQRDPGYAARENLEVLPGNKVRQRPGANNALGKIKFLFPNRFNVYLHDTPSRSLFSRSVRTFSHGCIRVEKPLDLAEYLLRDDPAWTREKIEKVLGDGRERWLAVPRPLPVHLVYWTAWVDGAGVLQFRKDVYGRDRPLLEMLAAEAEPAQSTNASEPEILPGQNYDQRSTRLQLHASASPRRKRSPVDQSDDEQRIDEDPPRHVSRRLHRDRSSRRNLRVHRSESASADP